MKNTLTSNDFFYVKDNITKVSKKKLKNLRDTAYTKLNSLKNLLNDLNNLIYGNLYEFEEYLQGILVDQEIIYNKQKCTIIDLQIIDMDINITISDGSNTNIISLNDLIDHL